MTRCVGPQFGDCDRLLPINAEYHLLEKSNRRKAARCRCPFMLRDLVLLVGRTEHSGERQWESRSSTPGISWL